MASKKPRPAGAQVRCVLYARCSTEEQVAEGTTSIEYQLGRCRKLAADRGWLVLAEYREEGFTGTTEHRPVWDEVMRRAYDGEIDAVIVLNVTRFARDTLSGLLIGRDLERHGVSLVLCETPDLDSTSDDGGMMHTMFLAFAERQRKYILRNMANGAHSKVLDGRFPSSRAAAPFGYHVVGERRDARLEPYDPEKATVLAAKRCVLELGYTAEQTAQWLNERGMLPRGSWRKVSGVTVHVPSRWTGHKVKLYLTKETLTGVYTWGGGRFATRDANGELRYGGPVSMTMEPILSQQEQEAIRQALSVHGPRETGELPYPWSGRLKSADAWYTGTFRVQRGKRTYRCRNKHTRRGQPACDCPWLEADLIDQRLWDAVAATLSSPDALLQQARAHLAAEAGQASDAAAERERLLAQAATRRENLSALILSLSKAGVDPDTVARTAREEQDAIAATERRAADIARFLEGHGGRSDMLDYIAGLAEHMSQSLASLDAEGQASVIAALDLQAEFTDPYDPSSTISIVSRRGLDVLVRTGSIPHEYPWPDGGGETDLPSFPVRVAA